MHNSKTFTSKQLQPKDIARLGMMIAILEISKLVLNHVPNIELVSFWIILFTLTFGTRTLYAVYGFVLIEGILYGIHFWWIAYLYVWAILVFLTQLLCSQQSIWFWSMLSALFGLCFGAFCAIPYFVTGVLSGGCYNGFLAGFSWWIAGIPYDILHGIGNFFAMLLLYKPIRTMLQRLS